MGAAERSGGKVREHPGARAITPEVSKPIDFALLQMQRNRLDNTSHALYDRLPQQYSVCSSTERMHGVWGAAEKRCEPEAEITTNEREKAKIQHKKKKRNDDSMAPAWCEACDSPEPKLHD